MNPLKDVPMPGTTHPAYADHEAMVRRWLHHELDGVSVNGFRIPKLRRVRFERYAEDKPITPDMETIELRRERCTAPAPYVGDPYVLTWDFAVDQLGRTVAGLTTYKPIPEVEVQSWYTETERELNRWLRMLADEEER